MKRRISYEGGLLLCNITVGAFVLTAIILFCAENSIGGVICLIAAFFFFLPQLINWGKRNSKSKEESNIPPSIQNLFYHPKDGIYIDYRPVYESMILLYKLENQDTIKRICDLMFATVTNYNKENNSNLFARNAIEMVFHRYHDDFSIMSNDDIKNCHFGIMAVTTLCCMILDDKAYQAMRKCEDFDLKVGDNSPAVLKKDFQELMDDSYIDWAMNQTMNKDDDGKSLNDDAPPFNGADLFEEVVKRFMAKYNLHTDDFFIPKEA